MKRACFFFLAFATLGIFTQTNLLGNLAALLSKPEPVEESMHEFMEYVFQPTYKRLKKNMATEKKSNQDWKAIKSDSLILAEAGNLLLIRVPKEDGEGWTKHTIAVRNLGGQLYQAARKKDENAARTAYREMLSNCNACHKDFADGKYQLQP